MKSFLIVISVAAAVSTTFAQETPQLKDNKDKVSYSFGLNVGFTFKKQNIDMNNDAFMAGFRDAMSGKDPVLSEAQVREVMSTFEKDMDQKQQAAAQKNTGEGEKYLADNKSKPGVKTTASGLQYKVLKDGTGASPKETDTVTVNYRGTLIDGTEFDSSYKRGEPATFPLNRVIKGWTEGLQLMKVGSKYQFFIPSTLAYGERASGQIGPNSALIFEVELLDTKAGTASSSASPSGSPK